MKKYTNYVAIAALAVGSLTFVGCNKDETGATPGEKTGKAIDNTTNAASDAAKSTGDALGNAGKATGDALSNAGAAATQKTMEAKNAVVGAVTPSGSANLDGVRSTVEGIVEGATKRNEFNALADHLIKVDADRVKAGKPDTKDIDDLADKFTTLWKDKYGDVFTVMDANKVYSPDFLKLSEETTSANGQKVATGVIAASHGMPELKLSFIDEGGKWRLDVPESVDSTTLHAKLLATLTALQDTSKWPAEKMEAYRAVSHHLLMAVNGG